MGVKEPRKGVDVPIFREEGGELAVFTLLASVFLLEVTAHIDACLYLPDGQMQ